MSRSEHFLKIMIVLSCFCCFAGLFLIQYTGGILWTAEV